MSNPPKWRKNSPTVFVFKKTPNQNQSTQTKQAIRSSKTSVTGITAMSEGKDHTMKLMGKTIQSSDEQQRHYYKGVKVFRYEGDEIELGKKALANLRANPAAMSRSIKFHETS